MRTWSCSTASSKVLLASKGYLGRAGGAEPAAAGRSWWRSCSTTSSTRWCRGSRQRRSCLLHLHRQWSPSLRRRGHERPSRRLKPSQERRRSTDRTRPHDRTPVPDGAQDDETMQTRSCSTTSCSFQKDTWAEPAGPSRRGRAGLGGGPARQLHQRVCAVGAGREGGSPSLRRHGHERPSRRRRQSTDRMRPHDRAPRAHGCSPPPTRARWSCGRTGRVSAWAHGRCARGVAVGARVAPAQLLGSVHPMIQTASLLGYRQPSFL